MVAHRHFSMSTCEAGSRATLGDDADDKEKIMQHEMNEDEADQSIVENINNDDNKQKVCLFFR